MMKENELEIAPLKKDKKKRVIRITHLPTGITVEDDGLDLEPIVERKKKLLMELNAQVTL
ncbi:MAG: hypothetical protein GY757_04505 [bacterium]|nr:hypothetical protein [bacterium]